MSDGILPARLALLVEGEVYADVLVYAVQCQFLVGTLVDRHGDEGRIRVRRTHQPAINRKHSL